MGAASHLGGQYKSDLVGGENKVRQEREHTVGKKELREGWEANLSENIDEILK